MKITETQKSIAQDGLLPILAMLLLVLLTELLVHPILKQFGTSGLLVYTLGLLALGMYFLDRTISPSIPECQRAWHGMVGGLLTWSFIWLNDQTSQILISQSAALWMLTFSLVVAALWRRVLPIGVRFFFLVFTMNWGARMLLQAESILGQFWPVFQQIYDFTGYIAIFFAVIGLLWIIFRARQRIMRMWIGVWVWFAILVALLAFWQPLL
ncbi:MAG TPA: hypothetical protein PK454_12790 [Anaerolineaceae bacterium]|nr:hypothetical protein [Anaerolineaceae bacterium]